MYKMWRLTARGATAVLLFVNLTNIYTYMHVCIYVCMYVYIYIHTYIHI